MVDNNVYTWTGGGDGSSWNDVDNWQGGANPNPVTNIPATPPDAGSEVEFDGSATIADAGIAMWLWVYGDVTITDSLDVSSYQGVEGTLAINSGSLILDGATLTGDGRERCIVCRGIWRNGFARWPVIRLWVFRRRNRDRRGFCARRCGL